MTSPTVDAAFLAYEQTADSYDVFTAHHDYELWLGNLLPELERYGLRGRRLLDVACGTGKSFLPMLERGWSVTGVDISPAMLGHAQRKAAGRARLRVEDMRALPRLGSFDLVWCLDDAVNYLLTAAELERCLCGFRRNLSRHGLCLFDVNTLGAYRGFFAETHVVERGRHRLVWKGQASPGMVAGSEAVARLEVRSASGRLITDALHRQRHFRVGDTRTTLGRAGLHCLAVFGHGTDAVLEQPLDELRHMKAVFIAKRS